MAPPKTLIIRIRNGPLSNNYFLDIIKILPSMMLKRVGESVKLSTGPDLRSFPQKRQSGFRKRAIDTADFRECVLDEVVDSALGDGFDGRAGCGGVWAMDGGKLVGALGGWGLCLVAACSEVLEDAEENVGAARQEVQARPSPPFRLFLLLLLLMMMMMMTMMLLLLLFALATSGPTF
jgi:hypothetical protein